MAEAIIMPKLGNTVESAIILCWHVAVGDAVSAGDLLFEIETDKATLEIESTADGVLLAQLCAEGEEVPVLSNIAVVGRAGESVADFAPSRQSFPAINEASTASSGAGRAAPVDSASAETVRISPRARNLAQRKGIDYQAVTGSGPGGRIIERDIEAALRRGAAKVTPVAQAMLDSGDYELAADHPRGRRVSKADLLPVADESAEKSTPLAGMRKTIARRMRDSLQSTAQLTLNASADARALQTFRRRLKASEAALGLNVISINDLLLFAVSRTLPGFPALNALFENEIIYPQAAIHLALAVDTDRGLMAPVIRHAESLTLRQLSAEARRLAEACRAGTIQPDELKGGSFTVSNLGALGIESFTPILNPPQVGILGVGAINLKPVQQDGDVAFIPHIGLSLTINHQVVDGAPAARFLQQLSANLAQIDLLVAT
ncbi:MAG: 2-oxo acid dehydrogenase subunit E2 [Chloroflexi bacterium]|nr:2-oxo acid dehydrogenase subunit E2 [Chloroflexota bacterium]